MTNYSNNLSTKHEKDYSDLWKPLPVQGSGADRHIDFSGELSRVVGGGVTLAADETRVALQDANRVAAGHYEPIYHPEDKKKEPVPA